MCTCICVMYMYDNEDNTVVLPWIGGEGGMRLTIDRQMRGIRSISI